MLKFYFSGAPNPTKVALFLEEAGLAYEPIPVDTRKGAQHQPEFLALNPNAKVPVIEDDGVVGFVVCLGDRCEHVRAAGSLARNGCGLAIELDTVDPPAQAVHSRHQLARWRQAGGATHAEGAHFRAPGRRHCSPLLNEWPPAT